MSQINSIINTLKNNEWVCGSSFQKMYIPTYAQRISEYNKKDTSMVIEGKRCDMHRHKGSVSKYRLVNREPVIESLFELERTV